jgi:Clp amino terminal domain, pathogenicity island component
MMFERFTSDARDVVKGAHESALRLGHRWIGCEHLLLALAATGSEVGVVLRDHGITPERVKAEVVRLAGPGGGVSLFDLLDRDALASIGIDVDAVRGRVEAAFGPDALVTAPRQRPPARRWARRLARRAAAVPAPVPEGKTCHRSPSADPGRIPFTARAKKCLMHSAREAQAQHSGHIGVEHLGLAVVSMADGAVPPILSAIGASGPHLRTEILSRYRQAS